MAMIAVQVENLQPFTGSGDISMWVKNSQVNKNLILDPKTYV